jgi:predicted MFS family arabinose efflux permease
VSITTLLRSSPSFRRLWLAQVVSELGDWFQMVALLSMFPTRGSGAAVVAGLFVARNVVALLVTPIAGVLADRLHRGAVMIGADLARAAVALGFVLVRGPEDVVPIFVLSLLLEALSVVFEPARGAALPQVVPPPLLYSANVLGGATWSTMFAVGSLAGGLVASIVGRRAAFVVNALSFVVSAILVVSARIPGAKRDARGDAGASPAAPASRAPARPLGDMKEGLAYLRANPAQASLLGLKPGALLAGASFVLVSVFADRVFPGDNALTMGWLLAGRGLGAFVVPLAAARIAGRNVASATRVLSFSFPLAVAGFSAFALSPTIAAGALALFVAHGFTSTIWVSSSFLLQMTVPNHVLGRVLAVELSLVTIAIAFSGAFVGVLLARFDVDPRAVAGAMASLLVVPFVVSVKNRRRHHAALAAAARDAEQG